jgi:hypothetical protein
MGLEETKGSVSNMPVRSCKVGEMPLSGRFVDAASPHYALGREFSKGSATERGQSAALLCPLREGKKL